MAIPDVLAMAGDAIVPLFFVALMWLVRVVVRNVNNAHVRTMIERASEAATDAVLAVSMKYVAALKAARRDGKLTAAEKEEAQKLWAREFKALLGPALLARILKALGISPYEPSKVHDLESALRESALGRVRADPFPESPIPFDAPDYP